MKIYLSLASVLVLALLSCGGSDPIPDLKYPATFKYKKIEHGVPKLYVVQSNGDLKEFPQSPTLEYFKLSLSLLSEDFLNDGNFPLTFKLKTATEMVAFVATDSLLLPYVRNNDRITVDDPATSSMLLADLVDNKTFKLLFDATFYNKPVSPSFPFGSGGGVNAENTLKDRDLLTMANDIKTKKKLVLNDTIIVSKFNAIYE